MPAPPADSSPTAKTAALPSPWASVVRGSDHDLAPPPPPSSSSPSPMTELPPPPVTPELPSGDDPRDADDNVGQGRVGKPAWKAFPNGVVEGGGIKHADGVTVGGVAGRSSGGVVMGDHVAWPALSESTKASFKSLSSDSLASSGKASSEGSSSSSQGHVHPNSPHKRATKNNGSPRPTPNNTFPQLRKPSKRNDAGAVRNNSAEGNSSSASNSGGYRQPPSGFNHPQLAPSMPPSFPTLGVPPNGYTNMVPPIMDFLNREPHYGGGGWDNRPAGVFSHLPMGDDHASSSRRGNFGPRDGNHQSNNNRKRRDRGRGNAPDRRDFHPQQHQRGASRGYRGPPTLRAPMFVAPQLIRPPFGPSIGFSDIASQFYYPPFPVDPYRSPPYVAPHPAEIMIPIPGTPLSALLVKQIDYYFSDDNLVKDDYLKSNMDDQGWVPIDLIAGFRRVKTLTDNIQLILECLGDSAIVEVKGDKVRRRGEWMKWVQFAAPGSFQPGSPSSRVANRGEQSLVTSLQNLSLEGGASTMGDTAEKVPKEC